MRLTYRGYNDVPLLRMTHATGVVEKLAAYEDAEEHGRLVVLNTAPQDKYGGLKRKYNVFKSDTGEPVEGSFVLRPDRDAAARIALEAYARATENKELADDIIRWIGDSGKTVILPCKVGDKVRDKIADHIFTIQTVELGHKAGTLFRCGNPGTDDYAAFYDFEIGERFDILGHEKESHQTEPPKEEI